MKIYLAGISTIPEMAKYGGGFLESYLYFRNKKEDLGNIVKGWGVSDLILDSGAFSAFTMNTKIDITDYGKTVLKNKQYITRCANLDVIGDSEATYKNWLILKEMGCNPLPVIHYGSEKKWFDIYLKEHKVEYLALGGLVPYTKQKTKLKKWLDYSFSLIKPYFPVKIHLFGVTTNWVLKRYPVYSCDSTGWLYAGKRGRILEFNGSGVVIHRDMDSLSKAHNYKQNDIRSGLAYRKFEDYLTKLWEKRGVKWE